jgi:hypothetical protein
VIIEEDRAVRQGVVIPTHALTYEFDAHGNWIAKFVRRENVPEASYDYRYRGNLFRTIVYFADATPSQAP